MTCSMKDIIQKTSCHSFAISSDSVLCIPGEPQNNHILCLTSPSTQAVIRGAQSYDPLLYPCYIFLCQLPTVNHECSSGLEAVGFQTLSGSFMQVDKGAVIEAKRFSLPFFQWQYCEHCLFELFDSICNASPHQ